MIALKDELFGNTWWHEAASAVLPVTDHGKGCGVLSGSQIGRCALVVTTIRPAHAR